MLPYLDLEKKHIYKKISKKLVAIQKRRKKKGSSHRFSSENPLPGTISWPPSLEVEVHESDQNPRLWASSNQNPMEPLDQAPFIGRRTSVGLLTST
ncbi:Uncharacterized protein APZ42_032331 [Daphnia magna]|uniref:Uncharacterized protein n=1 Tax=Daphnia magna TaxID=35525 RepID=A0A164M349_9CRUS|nr:Uncharacterized protein APZ42_032331 [Daphnia magna]